MMQKKKNINSLFFWIVIVIGVGLTIFFMPNIYKKLQDMDTPKVKRNINENKTIDKQEKITIGSKIIDNLFFPVMRNDKTKLETFYDFDEISINNFSNNDILYNAFLDIYDGYLRDKGKIGCTSNSKEFDAKYLKSRIKNIIGKTVSYNLDDFTVPNNNVNSKYTGLWKYDSNNNTYIYYGECNVLNNDIIYYDLKKIYNVETSVDNSVLYLYYYIGFAKIENRHYIIYNDLNMSNEVANGDFNDIKDIDNVFNNLDMNSFKIYKYTFKQGLCSYDNYCFYKGEWVDAR